jgi:aspartyl-tRNA(Asn)/glutamyl-tRNA(Gln) amidotransferase subunit A
MLTIETAAIALRNRELSSLELVRSVLGRADQLDGRLGAYITRFDESALEAAGRADRDFAAGIDRGPLQGIPFVAKDNLFAAEGPTTAHSRVRDRSWSATGDATAVARLRAAGAVLTGKVTLSEFAIGAPDLDSPYPRPRNPWDLRCWPGGSSSGSAVAVSAGLALAALGTDTAGSIRMPAAACGVSGLKATFGLVSTAGSIPLAGSLDHVGPLARSVWDCAAVLQTIAGVDPADATTLRAAPLDYLVGLSHPVGPVRVGVLPSPADAASDAALGAVYDDAIATLRSIGAMAEQVTLPHYAATVAAAKIILEVESFALHELNLASCWSAYSRSTRLRLATGAFSSSSEFLHAHRRRENTRARLDALFETVDVIVSPTFAVGAPEYGPNEEIDRAAIGAAASGVRYWSCVGYPALVIPMGFSDRGLPLSLQLVAKPLNETLLVRLGVAFQRLTDWHQREPAFAGPDSGPLWGAGPAEPADPPRIDPQDRESSAALLRLAGIDPGADGSAMAAAYRTHRDDAKALRAGVDRGPFTSAGLVGS